MALLCILSSLIIFVPNLNADVTGGIPVMTLAVFLLWGATLVLIGLIVGSLSDGWNQAMAKLTEAHRKDVLTDPLTGASNRRAYEFELSRRIAEWHRSKTPVSLILIDIDYFKKFNDRYGHQAGDAVLRAVADVLKSTVRDTDLIARYGGEEFAVVSSGIDVEEAKEIAERIRSLIESARFPFNGLILRLTISVGFAQFREGEELTGFVERADAALYSSKEAGRNCVHLHDGAACQQYGNGIATQITDSSAEGDTSRSASDPYTDESTGLPSQKVFLEELRRRTAERNRYGSRLSVAIVEFVEDLDDSAHDIHARKSLLATIAKLASSVLRDTDLITRYDSNSLAILLPATALDNALTPLTRIHANAASYHNSKYANLNYAVSIGVVELLADEHPGSALQRVESAINTAIEQGGNLMVWHDGDECISGAAPATELEADVTEG